MPEQEMESRTEPPTQHRLRELREEGRVAKFPDLTSAVMLVMSVLFLRFYGGVMVRALAERVVVVLSGLSTPPASNEDAIALLRQSIEWLLLLLAPMMAFVVGLALVTNIAQFGLVFSGKPVTPDLNKMNPMNGVQRLYSLRAFVSLVTNVIKITIVSVVSFLSVRAEVYKVGVLVDLDAGPIFVFAAGAAFRLSMSLALALLLLGLVDALYQRYQYMRDHRMTKVEVREEMRRLEGDPMIRARRRALQRRLAMQRMLHDVPEADVVVTNPTELAVALRYDAEGMGAPVVVAKGARLMAAKIRDAAIEAGVSIIEKKPLARALFRAVEVGDEIPAELFQAVAEVLAYVYELDDMQAAA